MALELAWWVVVGAGSWVVGGGWWVAPDVLLYISYSSWYMRYTKQMPKSIIHMARVYT